MMHTEIIKKNIKSRLGQSVVEYFIIFTLLLVVIVSTGLIDRIREGFSVYFDSAVARMR